MYMVQKMCLLFYSLFLFAVRILIASNNEYRYYNYY